MEITDILASGEHSSGAGPAVASSGRRVGSGRTGEGGAGCGRRGDLRRLCAQDTTTIKPRRAD